MSQHYGVTCQVCGTTIEDDGFVLECSAKHEEAALLTASYAAKGFNPDSFFDGIFRYRSWLPICQDLYGSGRTITYQSQKLCQFLGLPNLWIAFNGYWLERGATLETATFKELEAYAVLARLPKQCKDVLVVASAGNTAAAFAAVCSQNQIPCLLIVPASGLTRLMFKETLNPCVKIVSLADADYDDAIQLAAYVAQLDGFFLEGGVKNIGRRDGIGTTMLAAVETIEQLPDYYFQAIGSGAGAIAVHEAAKRLIEDGRFGQTLPRLMLSQNIPFMPIYHAWKSGQHQLIPADPSVGKQQVQQIFAGVLSNQRPPYAVRGGVWDALTESQGDMLSASNEEAMAATKYFEESEGVRIDPAAGVAFASLIKASQQVLIDSDARVLLHITGGRCRESYSKMRFLQAEPTLELTAPPFCTEETLMKLVALF